MGSRINGGEPARPVLLLGALVNLTSLTLVSMLPQKIKHRVFNLSAINTSGNFDGNALAQPLKFGKLLAAAQR